MIKRMFRARYFTGMLIVCLLLVSVSPALAQSTATLQGTVTDQQGAVLANAKVTARNKATGVERTTEADSNGNFQIAALPVGTYRVEIRADGFQTSVVNDLVLEVSQTVSQNFQLKVGGVSQEVNITADVPVIETTNITVGQVINQKTVQEIPLNGRHFVDLGLLIAGSVTPPQNGFLTAPLRGQGSFAFNTAGNREDTVNFMINGVNLNDQVQNQITFQPSINTVQEVKIDNSTFGAEYGRSSGAIVNIATRSGSNEWHGEAFEYIRNDALDSRNFFDRAAKKPPFKRNQFGAAFGGPIHKDSTFFLFTYEGTRQRQGLTLNGGVLTDAERAGVTDPTSKKLLDLIPKANLSGNRFVGSGTAPVNIDQWTGDVSHMLSSNDRLHGYYAFQRDLRGEPTLQGNTVPNFGDTRQSHRQILTVNETHTFGQNLVNEARFGFNRIHITFSPNAKLSPAEFGINNGITEPIALPQITVGGIGLNFGGPAGFPQGRGDTTFVLSDTASYLHGKHSIKMGGEYRRFLNNNFGQTPGTFGFANVAAFQTGTANAFSVTLGNVTSSLAMGALGLFVQDNLKLKPNLTFELGLRYDWFMSPTERYNRFVVFDPGARALVRVGSDIDQVYQTNNKNIQPRLGFVWDPFKNGKTSVRGGYSVLADQPVTNLVTPATSNPPLAVPFTFSGAIRFDNALTVARASGLAPASIEHGFNNAYIQSWNLSFERELTRTIGLKVAYVGSKGTHLRISRNVNQFLGLGVNRPFPTLSASSPILPGSAVGNITESDSAANSSYNALWITASKRISKGLQFDGSYSFSKSLDYNSLNSQGVVVQNSFNIRGDRGLSDYDVRNRFVLRAIYQLPFQGNRLAEGWQLSTIVQLQGGNPVNILVGNPINATLTGVASIRPDVNGGISVPGSPDRWFENTVCLACTSGAKFSVPASLATAHFGNLGRNVVIGPGFSNTDFSLLKTTRITESVKVQFRGEIFDIFNHANFGQPGRVAQIGSTTFGVISNTRFPTGDSGSSRQIQFALKLIF
ncbi:MAG TPA: TonB-dependent receptor [Blastocatellia bacterium]|nr:TonB-dependent receptor [Blastocatellia bacterium]